MHRHVTAVVLAATIAANAGAAEIIGPWTVEAPDSASYVSGSLNLAYWLNVIDAPVGVNTAFSGPGILKDGFANSAVGLTFEVVFNAGVTNGPGADLVLFEARYDAGGYSISADFDGFAADIAIGADDFVYTGEDRDYYYGDSTSGPFESSIWGGEIDLSDLGVAAGGTVTAIRFTATDLFTDPIGMGRIVPLPAPGAIAMLGLGLLAERRRRT